MRLLINLYFKQIMAHIGQAKKALNGGGGARGRAGAGPPAPGGRRGRA